MKESIYIKNSEVTLFDWCLQNGKEDIKLINKELSESGYYVKYNLEFESVNSLFQLGRALGIFSHKRGLIIDHPTELPPPE